MVNERDKKIREEMRDEILSHLRLLTVYFDDQGPIYRWGVLEGNIDFITKKLNGETARPASRL